MCPKGALKRIELQQKKAIRCIANYASTTPLFRKYKILKIEDLINLDLAKLSYKFTNKLLPEPVSKLFSENATHHDYQTRFGRFPMTELHKTAIYNNSFLRRSPLSFSLSNQSIRMSSNLKLFSKRYINIK